MTILLVVVSHLVEVVFIQLAHKTGEVAVLEVLRQDVLGEFFVLRAVVNIHYWNRFNRERTSNTTKLSPSFPHLTTLSSLGFSSILARVLVSIGGTHAL